MAAKKKPGALYQTRHCVVRFPAPKGIGKPPDVRIIMDAVGLLPNGDARVLLRVVADWPHTLPDEEE